MRPIDVPEIVKEHAKFLHWNCETLDILEGNLNQYIYAELKAQLSPQSFTMAQHRISPINIFPKLVDKLTNIYQTTVVREVVDGKKSDEELLQWYQDNMSPNVSMNTANELYNACRASLIQPYVHRGVPRLRSIMNDRFIVVSEDRVDPTNPTHVILIHGKLDGKEIYHVWSDYEFYIVDSDQKIRTDLMAHMGFAAPINPVGKLPFIYKSESKYKLKPKEDWDTLKMVKVIPVMLSDLNLAAMFQSFAIIYGIDLDDEDIKFAPNAFWRLKSDPTSDKKPEIGTIKPQVDYDQVLRLIESQLSMWLGTKGIRASSVGTLSADNFSSGISKLIDEMDTYEAREKQVSVFTQVEKELWGLIMNYMHPYWIKTAEITNIANWSTGATVKTKFAVQLNPQTRGMMVKDLQAERAAGFISQERAIKKLNPEMSDDDVLELMVEIAGEKTVISNSEEEETDDDETPPGLKAV